jgi:hypothetical protein
LQGWGSVLLRDFTGTSAVRCFWLYAAVMAMCGTDQLLKLWSVGGAVVPMCQSFIAHHGAVSGGWVGVRRAPGMQGQGLYSIRVFRGRSAVRQFCLHAVGAVMAMCGADQLLKLWYVGGGAAGVPVCQSFTAHHVAVSGGFDRVWRPPELCRDKAAV